MSNKNIEGQFESIETDIKILKSEFSIFAVSQEDFMSVVGVKTEVTSEEYERIQEYFSKKETSLQETQKRLNTLQNNVIIKLHALNERLKKSEE